MKPFEKELQKIIDETEQKRFHPAKHTVENRTTSDVYHYLLIRNLIEEKPFLGNDKKQNQDLKEIHVTSEGYAYFLKKKYERISFWIHIAISFVVSAISGIAASAIFNGCL
jgi:hypothetical protein